VSSTEKTSLPCYLTPIKARSSLKGRAALVDAELLADRRCQISRVYAYDDNQPNIAVRRTAETQRRYAGSVIIGLVKRTLEAWTPPVTAQ